jgi:hypothetical protein
VEKEISTKMCSFDSAAPFLVKSLSGDDIPLRLECENGISQCWQFNKGEAYMLTRGEGKELVICCFEGKNLKSFVDHIFKAASLCGFSSIRFHTKRPAILKLLNQRFHLIENRGYEQVFRSEF